MAEPINLSTSRAQMLAAIATAIRQLHEPGAVWEIRAPKTPRLGTVSGYYNDADKCARDVLAKLDGKAPGVYITLNPVLPALLWRASNRLQDHADATTNDGEIIERRNLLFDFDAKRPAGISSTDAEHDAATVRAGEVATYLRGLGWPEPLQADSGNGAHLIYRLEMLPPDPVSRQLIDRVLKALAAKFDDAEGCEPRIVVDTSVGNAARITKLYGTMVCKGDTNPERPHRRAHLVDVPDQLVGVTRAQLEALAATLPDADGARGPTAGSSAKSGTHGPNWIEDAGEYLRQHNIPATEHEDRDGGRKWLLDACVWNTAHTDHSAYVIQHADGSIAAGCSHNGCQGKGINEFRDVVETGWRISQTRKEARGQDGARTGNQSSGTQEHRQEQGNERASGNHEPNQDETVSHTHAYESRSYGLVWMKAVDQPVRLTNFTALITADTIRDDGQETTHAFDLTATLNKRTTQFSIPAERFNGMGWAAEHLGALAILMPGQALKDHARAAIQMLSQDAGCEVRRVYTHTGWRQVERAGGVAQWVYLHAGGAIGAEGVVPGASVALDGVLARYALPAVPTGADRVKAIRASLSMLDVAPETTTIPVYAAIWRAVLGGGTDLYVHLGGGSGTGKTAVAALAQQHYGAEMDARNLPGSWTSTANANEALAFAAKDALFVVDDLVSSGNAADQQRLHRDVERLLRGQGNQAGRARMRADGGMRAAKHPRGLILSTGEDMPRGQSLQARGLLLDHEQVDLARLTKCQRDAAAGLYAAALAGYVHWLAPQYEMVRAGLRDDLAALRTQATTSGQHRRTPEIVANLALGIRHFTRYVVACGAISQDEAAALEARAWRVLGEVAESQGDYQAVSEPAARFLALLASAIAGGHAHLATLTGGNPEDVTSGQTWGWRQHENGEHLEWRPSGVRVGWVEGQSIYLDPNMAHAAAQRLGRDTDEPINVSAGAVRKRLRDQGYLAEVDVSHKALTVRRKCEGIERRVLHLHADALSSDKKTAKTATARLVDPSARPKTATNGSFDGSFYAGSEPELPSDNPGNNVAGASNGSFGSFSSRRDAAAAATGQHGRPESAASNRALAVGDARTAMRTAIRGSSSPFGPGETAKTAIAPDALEGISGDCVVIDQVLICPECGGTLWYDAGERYGKRCTVHDVAMVPGGSAA